MAEHTPIPWNAASAYSSVVGVPIVGSKGQRIGNTAVQGIPAEWAEMKERAVADAAFIVKAVNNHDAMLKALQAASEYLESDAADGFRPAHRLRAEIDTAIRNALVGSSGGQS